MKIAIQGQAGSFHAAAAQKWLGKQPELIACQTFSDVFRAVQDGTADTGIVAMENSLYGSINEVYDLFEKYGFPIIGEIHLPVHHQLIGFPGAKLADITHVYSQLPALAQCDNYLINTLPDAERIEHHDTAESVRFIKEQCNPRFAAIASQVAAELYDMTIIDANIEDHAENYTRFLVIQPGATPPTDADRTSLVLTTSHQPGALAQVLTEFANSGINLAKLQSRPIIGSPWKYKFYIVVESAGEKLHTALAKIRAYGNQVTILGEYKSTSTLG